MESQCRMRSLFWLVVCTLLIAAAVQIVVVNLCLSGSGYPKCPATPDGPKCQCVPDTTLPPGRAKLHICAFHVAKDNPNVVIETQHYCNALNDELFQCVLYDSTGKNARLLGVEYVISDRLYQTLPQEEKQYWHSHEYEVKNGLLVAPGQPKECEKKLMTTLVRTWGKTFHTWPDPSTHLPIGLPRLMWSATGDGQISQGLIDARDQKFGINTKTIKAQRQEYLK